MTLGLRETRCEIADEARDWLAEEMLDVEPPPFRQVLDRARRMGGLPRELADVDGASLDALSDEQLGGASNFGLLDTFLEDARGLFDEETAALDDGVAGASAPTKLAKPQRNWVAILAAVAAVLLLIPLAVLTGPRALRYLEAQTRDYSSASDETKDNDGPRVFDGRIHGRANEHDPLGAEDGRQAELAGEPTPVPIPAPSLVLESEADPTDETDSTRTAPRAASDSARGKSSRADRLAELDSDARAAWKAGDLRTARASFEQIIRTGGRQNIVDIAFGDLFALARQLDDQRSLRRYWRQYAKRFPQGRYIDDARAGICRTSSSEEQRGCWERYLRDRPHGTYRQHAADVVAEAK